jgi:hypothetical protein
MALYYITPNDNRICGRRSFTLCEWSENADKSSLSLFPTLSATLRGLSDMFQQTGSSRIILETGFSAGRTLLHEFLKSRRSLNIMPNESDIIWKKLLLSSIVREPPDFKDFGQKHGGSLLKRLCGGRVNGGFRDFNPLEWLSVQIFDVNKVSKKTIQHPTYRIPLFLLNETKRLRGVNTVFDPKITEVMMTAISHHCCCLVQSPFPYVTDYGWLDWYVKPKYESDAEFVQSARIGGTNRRRKARQHSYHLYSLVNIYQKFITQLNLGTLPIFKKPVMYNTDKLVISLINLTFDTWLDAYYEDEYQPCVIDNDCFAAATRQRFMLYIKNQHSKNNGKDARTGNTP